MGTDFSRTACMKFPNQQNENVAPNVLGLLALAQSQLSFRQQHWNSVWRLREIF
jgi:hypothetical protein